MTTLGQPQMWSIRRAVSSFTWLDLGLGKKIVKKEGWGSRQQPGYRKSGVPQKASLYLRADKELFTRVRK